MKKVTIFSLHLGFGGIEKCVVNLANLLCDKYDVEIVSTYKIEDSPAFDINPNVKVKYLYTKYKPNRLEWKNSLKKLKLITFIKESYKSVAVLMNKKKKTIDAIKNCDSDIMISTRDLFNKWLSIYGNKKSLRIGWEHNHHQNNPKYIKNIVDSSKNLDYLVLVSELLKDFYSKIMKENNHKCKCIYIPNMLDYIPDNLPSLMDKRIVSIGRLSKEKGFSDLIDIFKKYKDKNPDSRYHLDIIGDGSEKNKLVDKIYSYGLVNDIKIHGFLKRDKINEILSKSSIYVMTSYTESFGIVLIEAMSFGIPCIAFNSAEGANDLIKDDYNGYLIPDRDFDKMIEKIELLTDDKNKRFELGKNARSFSLNYSSDNVSKMWIDLLEKRG